ncbi:carbohydrate-binding family 9-like protein [Solitalea sp. MAHUQ-68]|uniref:Carbohydrate-binding family 9-like protein n=1 Tax=Solitalea agri TaxID=2953739 RepID=A0A9X2JEU8_9SPHI|nr:carbohydrate-binding family 9-like protein [Solitalea agri]MCO4292781.1 carbohydrate-binding family 9-like protein [Solitalea agri]
MFPYNSLVLTICLFCSFCASSHTSSAQTQTPAKSSYFNCKKTNSAITVDGKADESAWENADWSDYFTDIEGKNKPAPFYTTRFKMLWSDQGLYIYAQLEEPQLQASLTKHDAIIFHDNDFEVFIDPGNDGLNYYEIEVNALNTVWDLKLDKAYSKGGRPDNNWTAAGLETAVALMGSLNNPTDVDNGWSVEMFIPWNSFKENQAPQLGESWKMNFSRVQWRFDTVDGSYLKRKDPKTGHSLPEYNWVWSPMGVVNMHIPEKWGAIKFVNE